MRSSFMALSALCATLLWYKVGNAMICHETWIKGKQPWSLKQIDFPSLQGIGDWQQTIHLFKAEVFMVHRKNGITPLPSFDLQNNPSNWAKKKKPCQKKAEMCRDKADKIWVVKVKDRQTAFNPKTRTSFTLKGSNWELLVGKDKELNVRLEKIGMLDT